MITIIATVLAGLLAVFAVVAALQPSTFRVARSVAIHASATAIYPAVARPRGWEAWSPWPKLDPKMEITYSGPPEGAGAKSSWVSEKVGDGTSTVIESRDAELVRFRLEMLKPMPSVSEAAFTFEARNGETIVTWSLAGRRTFVAKAFGLIFNCDKMIGPHFERGLHDLKALVEQQVTAAKPGGETIVSPVAAR